MYSLASGDRKVVLRGGGAARYVPTGHLVYALGGTLLAVPFDLNTLEVRGGPVPVLDDVRRAALSTSGAAQAVFSATGSLAFVSGSAGAVVQQTLALVDRAGKIQPLGFQPMPYGHPRISPDGKQFAVATDDGKDANLWVGDLSAGATLRRLTFVGRNFAPIWSHDGRSIAFASQRDGDRTLYRQSADGTGTAERLTRTPAVRPESWHPDGKTLLYVVGAGVGDLWTVSAGAEPKPQVTSPASDRFSVFSPDGRWFAYASQETGRYEVYVQPFPATGAKYQVSTSGGVLPLWSRDGSQLFYSTVVYEFNERPGALVAVDVRAQASFGFGQPAPVATAGAVLIGGGGRNYDITPDGRQFLIVLPASRGETGSERPPAEEINIVLNWMEELKQRVPTK